VKEIVACQCDWAREVEANCAGLKTARFSDECDE
jgi:hypothetical protein